MHSYQSHRPAGRADGRNDGRTPLGSDAIDGSRGIVGHRPTGGAEQRGCLVIETDGPVFGGEKTRAKEEKEKRGTDE